MIEVAIEKLQNHLWYLTEEVVVFSMFSNKVNSDTKQQLASKLLTTPKPNRFILGKPSFPNLDENSTITSLIGPKSWSLFQILNVDTNWLMLPPSEWNQYDSYNEVLKFVTSVKTVNDSAERGIKFVTDYISSLTHNENQLQWLLQAVESHRKKLKSFDKKSLNNFEV